MTSKEKLKCISQKKCADLPKFLSSTVISCNYSIGKAYSFSIKTPCKYIRITRLLIKFINSNRKQIQIKLFCSLFPSQKDDSFFC